MLYIRANIFGVICIMINISSKSWKVKSNLLVADNGWSLTANFLQTKKEE